MIYDLSHRLNNKTPVYPGTDSPVFKPVASIETNGYRETHFSFHSHLGTHIDAPAHMLNNGLTLDQMDISAFCGEAVIIKAEEGSRFIEKSLLEPYRNSIAQCDFVLFKTGWSNFWGDNRYFGDFPTLSADALEVLLQFKLKGIGFDTISADPVESSDYKNHYAIFEKGWLIIENLIFPEDFNEQTGEFSCYPLPYEKADGSPVRAVLKV